MCSRTPCIWPISCLSSEFKYFFNQYRSISETKQWHWLVPCFLFLFLIWPKAIIWKNKIRFFFINISTLLYYLNSVTLQLIKCLGLQCSNLLRQWTLRCIQHMFQSGGQSNAKPLVISSEGRSVLVLTVSMKGWVHLAHIRSRTLDLQRGRAVRWPLSYRAYLPYADDRKLIYNLQEPGV